MKLSTTLLVLAFSLTGWSKPTPLSLTEVCTPNTTPVYIGKDKNVEMQYASCPENKSLSKGHSLEKRQARNVCGAPCETFCFTPAEGGPTSDDCSVIADALKYESQNTAALFQVPSGSGNNTVVMTYSSCKSFFLNQDLTPLAYCRTDWASLVDWLTPDCSAANGAHGGLCVADDQAWYVQVQHS